MTDGDALFRGDVALGDQPEDTLTISSALVSSENLACETEDVCTGTALDPATDTPDVPATCTGTVTSGHPDNGNACDAAGGAWDTAATKLAADCPTGYGCIRALDLARARCATATRAMPLPSWTRLTACWVLVSGEVHRHHRRQPDSRRTRVRGIHVQLHGVRCADVPGSG